MEHEADEIRPRWTTFQKIVVGTAAFPVLAITAHYLGQEAGVIAFCFAVTSLVCMKTKCRLMKLWQSWVLAVLLTVLHISLVLEIPWSMMSGIVVGLVIVGDFLLVYVSFNLIEMYVEDAIP